MEGRSVRWYGNNGKTNEVGDEVEIQVRNSPVSAEAIRMVRGCWIE